jgi:hypothetical protein
VENGGAPSAGSGQTQTNTNTKSAPSTYFGRALAAKNQTLALRPNQLIARHQLAASLDVQDGQRHIGNGDTAEKRQQERRKAQESVAILGRVGVPGSILLARIMPAVAVPTRQSDEEQR